MSGSWWEIPLAVTSLILLAGGTTAVIRRSMSLAQALTVLGVAVGIGGVVALALGLPDTQSVPGWVYRGVIVASLTLGGVSIAVTVVSRR